MFFRGYAHATLLYYARHRHKAKSVTVSTKSAFPPGSGFFWGTCHAAGMPTQISFPRERHDMNTVTKGRCLLNIYFLSSLLGWRDGSQLGMLAAPPKDTSSGQIHIEWLTTPALEYQVPSSGLCRHLNTHGMHAHTRMHVCIHAYSHK